MEPKAIAQVIAAGRVAIGAALIASPTLVTGRWLGAAESERPGARVLGIGLGGRDLVIGAGVLAAAGSDAVKPWLLAAAVADLGDLTATLRYRAELPAAGVAVTALVAGGAAAAGFWLALQDDV